MQLREIQRSILGDRCIDERRIDVDDGERICTPPQRRDLKIDEQPLESEQLPPLPVGERKVLDGHLQQERVDADLSDGGNRPERFGNVLDERRANQSRREPETRSCVQGNEQSQHSENARRFRFD